MGAKKKILIYDNNLFFYKYFKKNLFTYDFEFFSEYETDPNYLGQFDIIVFILERPVDILTFFKMYENGVLMIFGSNDKNFQNIEEEMTTFFGVKMIDMSGTKMDIRDQLKECLRNLEIQD